MVLSEQRSLGWGKDAQKEGGMAYLKISSTVRLTAPLKAYQGAKNGRNGISRTLCLTGFYLESRPKAEAVRPLM